MHESTPKDFDPGDALPESLTKIREFDFTRNSSSLGRRDGHFRHEERGCVHAIAEVEVAARLKAGTVWINETQHLSPLASFAGMKQSGLGVENGIDGLLEYTNTQTIVVRKG